MPILAIFSWSQYTTPPAIPNADLLNDTHSNHPDTAAYNPSAPSWIGETFTFNGGTPSQIVINDDDTDFEDAYVETGTPQTLDQAITIDGTDYPAGSVVENEFSMVDGSGNEIFIVRINGQNVGFTYPVGQYPMPGETFTGVEGRDGAAADSSDGISGSSEPYAGVVCFAKGTLIQTSDGLRKVENLKIGDMVETFDRGLKAIRWVRSDTHFLGKPSENATPILISRGALGSDRPRNDLIVSPQHRILVGGIGQLQSHFNSEVLVAAKALTSLPGIRYMKGRRDITWIHFSCDQHEIVTANGCMSESLLLGPMVVNGMPKSERNELAAIYSKEPVEGYLNGPSARPLLKVGKARRILNRIANECSLAA